MTNRLRTSTWLAAERIFSCRQPARAAVLAFAAVVVAALSPARALAQDYPVLTSWSGDYWTPGSGAACEARAKLDAGDRNVYFTTWCEHTPGSSILSTFYCVPGEWSCVLDGRVQQTGCSSSRLRLLESGNVILENPCLQANFEFFRRR